MHFSCSLFFYLFLLFLVILLFPPEYSKALFSYEIDTKVGTVMPKALCFSWFRATFFQIVVIFSNF